MKEYYNFKTTKRIKENTSEEDVETIFRNCRIVRFNFNITFENPLSRSFDNY